MISMIKQVIHTLPKTPSVIKSFFIVRNVIEYILSFIYAFENCGIIIRWKLFCLYDFFSLFLCKPTRDLCPVPHCDCASHDEQWEVCIVENKIKRPLQETGS